MSNLIIEMHQIEKSYLSKDILSIDYLTVYENEKIGIIGPNGAGKSTLLKLITQELKPDSGQVNTNTTFAYYEQIAEDLQVNYDQIDPLYLSQLQIPSHSVSDFSGGQQSRLRLAAFLSNYHPAILLDEPTTHLDKDGVEFLVNQLKYYYGTLLVVSHNRYFLDEVVTTIWEVKEGKVRVYPGNYSDYQAQKEQERIEQEQAFENFTREKTRLEQAAKQKHQKAEKLATITAKQKGKSIKPDRLSSSKQKDSVQKAAHKSAKAIQKRAEQLESVAKPLSEISIQFPKSKVLEIHNPYPIMGEEVTIKKGDHLLLDKANFQFELGKRIGIIGPNGSGKSSLLQHILNGGEGIILSNKIVFATYQQMSYQLKDDLPVIDFLKDDSYMEEGVIRSILNKLGFDQTVVTHKIISDLSGGEATRLVLAKLFTKASNVLILDEPTNFIDIPTIEALESLMKSYQGTIIFTSHDQYFMDNMAHQQWEISNQQLNRIF
ncbi:ribosomal protection-like ABC-F family protein [Fundicoccus culcitae]|uniref:ABC-F type ribosomal protection protein n=1 Tax=Fundicoccus culcitae TaxID=2969821 RepID=A0ABY5P8J8_9LACT|nr:ABC-F type ribosomal protection protein [Fundicoccus culcitae]UUX34743.1 ABC-F type ribosomal protection protein [Fundicoccus culcitae]